MNPDEKFCPNCKGTGEVAIGGGYGVDIIVTCKYPQCPGKISEFRLDLFPHARRIK